MTRDTRDTGRDRQSRARRNYQAPGQLARAGMTLVEMLVAVSVLAVMILAVSSILVQTQRFISAAQENRRSHAMAFTIARIIRRDLSRVSKDGFLNISSGGNSGSMLVFSTAGPVSGINSPVKGDGSIICYAQQVCTNGKDTSKKENYLWRPEYVCNCTTGTPSATFEGERVNVNFSILRSCAIGDSNSPFQLQSLASAAAGKAPSSSFQLPPTQASQVEDLWQVLVVAIEEFKVEWTDGTNDNGILNWSSAPGLWTHQNQANWPKAIKISFKINDPSMPKEFRDENNITGIAYEVISTIGQ